LAAIWEKSPHFYLAHPVLHRGVGIPPAMPVLELASELRSDGKLKKHAPPACGAVEMAKLQNAGEDAAVAT
jgi:hypothetical protein